MRWLRSSLLSLFSSDLAIDLGTANSLVYCKGRGIVVSEPSIIAVNQRSGKVEAVGGLAKSMLGRTPGNILLVRPMKDGVIADFEVTERMLEHLIKKAHGRKMYYRVVIGVPSEITQVEKRAVNGLGRRLFVGTQGVEYAGDETEESDEADEDERAHGVPPGGGTGPRPRGSAPWPGSVPGTVRPEEP